MHHVLKSVACRIFYNLKKPEPIIKVFGTQYPYNPSFYKKLSWCWQTRATPLWSVKVTKYMVSFDMLGTVSFVCYSNFVPKIFDFKNIVTLKSGSEVTQGYW